MDRLERGRSGKGTRRPHPPGKGAGLGRLRMVHVGPGDADRRPAQLVWDERDMNFRVETEREDDGRWIAELVDPPGALAYGSTRDEAVASAEALAVRVAQERMRYREALPERSVEEA